MSNCTRATLPKRWTAAGARALVSAVLAAASIAAVAQTPPLLPRSNEPLRQSAPRAAPQPQQVVPSQSAQLQTRPLADSSVALGQISPRASELLARSEHAAASFQACIYDAMRQGIPIQVAITLCEIKLWQDDKRGWGDAGIASAVFKQPPPAPNAAGACATGVNPTLGKGNPYATVGDKTLEKLSESLSNALFQTKDAAARDVLKAQLDTIDAELDLRARTGKSVKDTSIEVSVGKVVFEEPAKTDSKGGPAAMGTTPPVQPAPQRGQPAPGKAGGKGADGGTQRTSPEAGCAQTVAQAQEFLRECQRTGWKTGACQVFAARVKRCPDPRLAYVDPGAGYACGESADPKLVAEAYARRCEQLVRPGPDGSNPCRPQAPELDARVIKGVKDLCNDPKAYHTGEGCVVELVAPSPAGFQRGGTVQEVIAIATNKLGGPIFVLPKPPPAPRGPQPMPGPGTGPQPKPGATAPLLAPPPGGNPR